MTSYAISWKLFVVLLCVLQSGAFFARAMSIVVVSVTRYRYLGDGTAEPESTRLEFTNTDYGYRLKVPESAQETDKSNLKSYGGGNVCFGLTGEMCGSVKFAEKCSSECKYKEEVDATQSAYYETNSIRHHTLGECIGDAELTCAED